jgi:hypothetical protein
MTNTQVGKPVSATVLRDVTVVDTRDGSLTPHVDITLDGGRIAAIGPAATGAAAPDEPPPETAGKYVVPGYLEMHAHPFELKDPAGALELMLSHGITGFRQMSGSPKMLRQQAAGTLPMPADSPAVVAMPGTVLTPLNAGTESAAVATVAEQCAAGADFIKVGFVPPDAFYAAQAEAARLGIPILGHLPVNIDVVRASRGGMRSIEHLGPGLGILAACSADEHGIRTTLSGQKPVRIPSVKIPFMDRIVAAMVRRMAVNPTKLAKSADVTLMQHAIDTFDEARARGLAERFAADGTWQCPTLIRKRTTQLCDAPEYRTDPDLRYVAAGAVRLWSANAGKFAARPASERATFRAEYALQLRATHCTRSSTSWPAWRRSGAGWSPPGPSGSWRLVLMATRGWLQYGGWHGGGRHGGGWPGLARHVLALRNERLVLLPALQPLPARSYRADRGRGHEGDDLILVQVRSRYYLRD